MGTDHSISDPIIFFDGVCNLCNASVQFVLKRDKEGKFKFASLQSDFASQNLPEHLVTTSALQSIVLKEEGRIKTKSSAALMIARHLSGGWSLMYGFMIIPKFIRDALYDLIAKNRYQWFGKQDQCMVPSSEWKNRFIE